MEKDQVDEGLFLGEDPSSASDSIGLDNPSEELPPPSDSALREGDEDLAGPNIANLAFNDDDVDTGPEDSQHQDDAGVDDVAQEVTRELEGAAEAMNAQLAEFLRVAHSQVGYRASRSSPGAEPISKYGKWLGFPNGGKGHYCAAFVSWCGAKAGIGARVGKSGWVRDFLNTYKKKGRFGSVPRVGSLVIFDWERNGRVDHIGIVVAIGSGYIDTVEGNTGDPNGVYLRRRRGPTITGYCYPSFAKPKSKPSSKPAPSSGQVWHTVRKGETLTAISKQYGVSIATLLSRNKGQGSGQGKITNPNLILVNQRIRIK